MIDKMFNERYNVNAQFLNAVQRCRKGQQIVERWPEQALRSRCLALRFAELFSFERICRMKPTGSQSHVRCSCVDPFWIRHVVFIRIFGFVSPVFPAERQRCC